MKTDKFIADVKESLQLQNHQQAFEATKAVLGTLGRRVDIDEAKNAKSQMPGGLKEQIWATDWVSKVMDFFGQRQYNFETVKEMLAKVDSKLKSNNLSTDAKITAETVMHEAKKTLSEGQIDDVSSQLPKEVALFWQNA